MDGKQLQVGELKILVGEVLVLLLLHEVARDIGEVVAQNILLQDRDEVDVMVTRVGIRIWIGICAYHLHDVVNHRHFHRLLVVAGVEVGAMIGVHGRARAHHEGVSTKYM